MALSVSVSRDGTDRVVFEFVRHADSIILLMRRCTSRRSSMEQQNSPPEFRMVAADVNHMHTDHPTSTHACRWPWNPSRVHNGSLSYTRACRATTSPDLAAQLAPKLADRQAEGGCIGMYNVYNVSLYTVYRMYTMYTVYRATSAAGQCESAVSGYTAVPR